MECWIGRYCRRYLLLDVPLVLLVSCLLLYLGLARHFDQAHPLDPVHHGLGHQPGRPGHTNLAGSCMSHVLHHLLAHRRLVSPAVAVDSGRMLHAFVH